MDNRLVDVVDVSATEGVWDVQYGAQKTMKIEWENTGGAGGDLRLAMTIAGMPNTILQKVLMGVELSEEEKDLANRTGFWSWFATKGHEPFKNDYDAQYLKVETRKVYGSMTVFSTTPPAGFKAVLLGIASTYSSLPGECMLSIYRGEESIPVSTLDLYGMPGLDKWIPMRIVGLRGIRLVADVTGGTHFIKIKYAISRISIPEKLRWGLPLDDWEREIVDQLNLLDYINVGIFPTQMVQGLAGPESTGGIV